MMDKSWIAPYIRPLAPRPTGLIPSGGMRRSPKALLFDIYGTLFISGSGGIGARSAEAFSKDDLEALLARYAIPGPARLLTADLQQAIRRAHARLRGKGVDFPEIDIRRIWHGLLPDLNPERIERFAVEYEMITNPVYPMPCLADLLAAAKARNLALGIISNAQFYTSHLFPWFLGRDLAQLGVDPELVQLSFQSGHAKPSPVMFQALGRELRARGISNAEVLYVGNDMENDMRPAGAVGFQTALFAGDRRSLRLRGASPESPIRGVDLVVSDLGQLMGHLTAIAGRYARVRRIPGCSRSRR